MAAPLFVWKMSSKIYENIFVFLGTEL